MGEVITQKEAILNRQSINERFSHVGNKFVKVHHTVTTVEAHIVAMVVGHINGYITMEVKEQIIIKVAEVHIIISGDSQITSLVEEGHSIKPSRNFKLEDFKGLNYDYCS